MRRIPGILLIVAVLGACFREAYRGALVLLLRHGEYALVERWGGEAFYLPALRHYGSHSPAGIESRVQLYEWVKHRIFAQFPMETLSHLELLPTGDLALLLRGADRSGNKRGAQDECRAVILDPDRSDLLVAASEPVEHDAWRMRWQGDWVLLDGGRSMTSSLAYHREGSVLRLVPTRMKGSGSPYFWGLSEFEDRDGDGIPEVVTTGTDEEACPRCGRTLVPREVIWKLLDGAYQEWTVGEPWCTGCGPSPSSD